MNIFSFMDEQEKKEVVKNAFIGVYIKMNTWDTFIYVECFRASVKAVLLYCKHVFKNDGGMTLLELDYMSVLDDNSIIVKIFSTKNGKQDYVKFYFTELGEFTDYEIGDQ